MNGLARALFFRKRGDIRENRLFSCRNLLSVCFPRFVGGTPYFKKGIVPDIEKWHNKNFLKNESFINGAILYFGIGFEEMHREGPIRKNWQPFKVEMPLIENVIDNDAVLKKYFITPPRLYAMQFPHNNCKGRCVKGGQGHFKNLLMKDEKTFIELMEQEIIISEYIRYCKQPAIKSGKRKDYLYKDVWEFVTTGKKSEKIKHLLDTSEYTKNWSFGVDKKGQPIKKPYTFMKTMSLEELEKKPVQCDIWDIAGCGCFVDYGVQPTY